MAETISIELTHSKAMQLLQDLEAMNIIRLITNKPVPSQKLSDKYRGVLTKEDGENLKGHIQKMRDEWSDI